MKVRLPLPHSVPAHWRGVVSEFSAFARKNALSCLFPALILLLLAITRLVPLPVARYDFLLAGCLLAQVVMVATRYETLDEFRVIVLFHLLGLTLELFKTHVGSWSYPEPALSKVAGVPLYSGFMYASLASFMIQAWRRFRLRLRGWPAPWTVAPIGAAIYLNFFTNYWGPDLRWWLAGAVLIAFRRAEVIFTPTAKERRLPLALAFVLIGMFVYGAENVATYLGAWVYPHQEGGWRPVGVHKVSSWSLLVIVSFLIVAQLKRVKAGLGRGG